MKKNILAVLSAMMLIGGMSCGTGTQNKEGAAKPGAVVVDGVKLTGIVESIDTNNRTIALKGPAGNVRTYKVGPEAKRFNEIKRGDQVVLRVTQAVALSVGNP
jgi:hypothetical protein